MKILLDYLFPISSIEPTPAASTAFLKQVCVVALPKDGGVVGGEISLCTSAAQYEALVGSAAQAEIAQLFAGGLSRVYVLPNADLDLAAILEASSDFFTLLITSDFDETDVNAADFGTFDGVIGMTTTDTITAAEQAAIANRCAFFAAAANKSKSMFYAFGKLLSNSLNWKNQQYIPMPFNEGVGTLGDAEYLFENKISFVINDDQYSNRLSLFAAGGKAIVAPYIERNLEIDMQSKALAFISGNQPSYTITNAALLEDELQKVIEEYFENDWLEAGTVSVTLEQDNFVASGDINIAEPKALWRIFGEMRQTL